MKIHKSLSVTAVNSLVMVAALTVVSCAGIKSSQSNGAGKTGMTESKSIVADYSGIYKLSHDQVCDIVITIKKDNSGYTYSITGKGVKNSGKISVVQDGESTYLAFTGTKRSGDKSAIEGAYSDGKIMIQNYGNAMNQYICFKQCDAKFLEFVR